MHLRTITCSCLTDTYPLSQDPTAAGVEVSRILHYQWYSPSPSVLLQTSS